MTVWRRGGYETIGNGIISTAQKLIVMDSAVN
jgi:hypothetical protein